MQRATLILHCGWDFNCTQVRKFWVNVPLAALIQPLGADVLWSEEGFNMFSRAAQAWLWDTRVAGLVPCPGRDIAAWGYCPGCPFHQVAPASHPCRWASSHSPRQITQKGCHGGELGAGGGLQHLKGSEHWKAQKLNKKNSVIVL